MRAEATQRWAVFACGYPVIGSVICKLAPPDAEAVATMRPLWNTMIFCTSARPSPVPLRFEVKNGRNTRSRNASGMPGPLSLTAMR